jgi:hypothetical protein
MRAYVVAVFIVSVAGAISACRKPAQLVEPPPPPTTAKSKATEQAAKKKTVKVPDVTPEAEWVAKLLPLTKSPRASKPKEILDNYMNAGRDRFFFDVAPVGEIEVSVVRGHSERWQVSMQLGSVSATDLARSDGLEVIARDVGLKGVHWWKITRGTFAGHFVRLPDARHRRDPLARGRVQGHAPAADRRPRCM